MFKFIKTRGLDIPSLRRVTIGCVLEIMGEGRPGEGVGDTGLKGEGETEFGVFDIGAAGDEWG